MSCGPFRLDRNAKPLSVDIFTSAISSAEDARMVNLAELEAKIRDLVTRVTDVAPATIEMSVR